MKTRPYLFTSESVSEGHPDKVCDQISDAILDAYLKIDPKIRVACEAFASTNVVVLGGEVSVQDEIDYDTIIRNVVKEIGYDKPEYGFDEKSIKIMSLVHSQSEDIAQGVDGSGLYQVQGAGDQGIMFGYACTDTIDYMPAPISIAHQILKKAAALRKENKISWLRPDAKSQVTVAYENRKAQHIEKIVVSHQHDENVSYEEIKDTIISQIIKPVLEKHHFESDHIEYFINPTGRFVIGGPAGDTGLTGRKIIVDTYGGAGRHGGGAFSGKDPSKVDRSASYMARYIAKNIVAAGVCPEIEIEVAYAIGYDKPLSLSVNIPGCEEALEKKIENMIPVIFDLTPKGIIQQLDLYKPIYQKTASYGHFGRPSFAWEKLDKVEDIKRLI